LGVCGIALGWVGQALLGNADARGQAVADAVDHARGEPAQEEAPGSRWVRLKHDAQGDVIAMETAIVRYVRRADVVAGASASDYPAYVDLVGAVHIGDLAYYRGLNERFRAYDSVLYELVAPEGTVVEKGRGTSSAHPLGALQNGMKSMLEVEHQLEKIDYTRDNFVHADLSPDEFIKSMENRNEGFLQMYFRLLGSSLAQQSQQAAQGESADLDILSALMSRDRPRKLKIAMAKQFENMEAVMIGLSGADGSTLITQRNLRALEVLKNQLAAGKQKLAIFYGAGHLSEMNDQLADQFDLVPVAVTWVEAWNLRP
jgi:hypothetical protein